MLIRVGKGQRHPGLQLLRRRMTVQRCSLGSPGTCSTRETAGTAARSSSCGDDDADGDGEEKERSWKWAGWDDGSGQYLGGIIGVVDQARCAALSMRVGSRAEGSKRHFYQRAGKSGTAGQGQKRSMEPWCPGAAGGGTGKAF